jgi:nitrate reductase cytochrome c-type subunit
MKKTIYFLMILCLCTYMSTVLAADKDCPDCPKDSTNKSVDPKWKEFVAPPLVPGELPDCHRVQFGKQDCMECHKKETPVSYNAWLSSRHGINNVKCGICHGDVNNYRARPDKVVCMGCHSMQVKNMPAQALVTNCSYCHKGHWFTVHKVKDYEKCSPGREQRFKVPGF